VNTVVYEQREDLEFTKTTAVWKCKEKNIQNTISVMIALLKMNSCVKVIGVHIPPFA